MATLLAPRSSPGEDVRLPPRSSSSRILNGSLVLLIGTGVVTVLNLAYNVSVARLLGPAGFGHAAAAVTLLMLVSAVTLSFQLVCAKFIARSEDPKMRAAVYHRLLRQSWMVGVLLGSTLLAGSGIVAVYLNLPSRLEVALLAVGFAFYVPLGAKRGAMQGSFAFRALSWNFILEAVVRFLAALILVKAGFGVIGVVSAISISVVVAYLFSQLPADIHQRPSEEVWVSFREGMQAIVFFVGQVVINNVDVLLVKHFFDSERAGLYAAVALVGRVVYFASWSVVSAMFPITAGAKPEQEKAAVIALPLMFVTGISLVFVVTLNMVPDMILQVVFGPEFRMDSIAPLLSLYAAATGLYALSVVLMAYEMSRRIANTGWLQLVFSGAIVAGIYLFHEDLHQVVLVQLILMIFMLMVVSFPFLRRTRPAFQEAA